MTNSLWVIHTHAALSLLCLLAPLQIQIGDPDAIYRMLRSPVEFPVCTSAIILPEGPEVSVVMTMDRARGGIGKSQGTSVGVGSSVSGHAIMNAMRNAGIPGNVDNQLSSSGLHRNSSHSRRLAALQTSET